MKRGMQIFFGRRAAGIAAAVLSLAAICVSGARGQYREDIPQSAPPSFGEPPPIVEKTGAALPLDATFTTWEGKSVRLGDEFKSGKPVVVALVYYTCPSLCGYTQQALVNSALSGPLGLKLGTDYNIVVASFDPSDTPAVAASTRKIYADRLGLSASDPAMTYLVGSEESTQGLMDAVGYSAVRNPVGGDKYLHRTGIFVCTPDGRLSQTIQGINFPQDTLHHALVEASGGKLGRGLLEVGLCCGAVHFDAASGRYVQNPWFYAGTAAGVVTLAMVGGFMMLMWRGEKQRAAGMETDAGAGAGSSEEAGRELPGKSEK